MFDIGFWELVVVGVVGLLVVGPDKLPGLAREAGLWVGRARRMAASLKADLKREIDMEALRTETRSVTAPVRELMDDARKVVQLEPGAAGTAPPPAASAEPAAGGQTPAAPSEVERVGRDAQAP